MSQQQSDLIQDQLREQDEMNVPKVYEAICAVQGALAKIGIGKNSTNQQQGYKFRGIDAVYGALSPLLAEHGLCVIPRMTARGCEERQTKSGSPLFYVTIAAEFDFVAVADGSKHTVKTYGEAMDSGDKATNKAMSAAYKYAALMTFAVPTEGDNDADAVTHEVAPKAPRGSAKETLQDAFNAMPAPHREIFRSYAACISETYAAKGIGPVIQYLDSLDLDAEGKMALWSLLDSGIRSIIKKEQERIRKLSPPQKEWTDDYDEATK